MEDLLETLEARGIAPGASKVTESAIHSHLVEHRIIGPQRAEEGESEQTGIASTEDDAPLMTESELPKEPQPEPEFTLKPDSNPDLELDLVSAESKIQPSLFPDEEEPKATTSGPLRTVETDDLVTYVNVEHSDNILSVRIVHGNSDPNAGVVNEQTLLAEALLGAEEGDTVEAHLPMGTRRFRILEVRPH
jgi:hypothetical protein